jgi:hypothetical protein
MKKSKYVKAKLGGRSEIQYFDDNMNPISKESNLGISPESGWKWKSAL